LEDGCRNISCAEQVAAKKQKIRIQRRQLVNRQPQWSSIFINIEFASSFVFTTSNPKELNFHTVIEPSNEGLNRIRRGVAI
jgi:hypothetical protein